MGQCYSDHRPRRLRTARLIKSRVAHHRGIVTSGEERMLLAHSKPRSGERLQPTACPELVEGAQAVGHHQTKRNQPRRGERNNIDPGRTLRQICTKRFSSRSTAPQATAPSLITLKRWPNSRTAALYCFMSLMDGLPERTAATPSAARFPTTRPICKKSAKNFKQTASPPKPNWPTVNLPPKLSSGSKIKNVISSP